MQLSRLSQLILPLLVCLQATISTGIFYIYHLQLTSQATLPSALYIKHLLSILIGCALGIIVYKTYSKSWISQNNKSLIIIALILASLPLIPHIGLKQNGASQWVQFFYLTFKPFPFALLLMILAISYQISPKINANRFFKRRDYSIATPFLCLMFITSLYPSINTVIFCLCFLLFTLVLAYQYTLFLGSSVLIVAGCTILAFASPYRVARLLKFTDIDNSTYEQNYHLYLSLQTLKTAGMTGKKSVDASFSHNNSLFYDGYYLAYQIEQLGYLGGGVVISISGLILLCLLLMYRNALFNKPHAERIIIGLLGFWILSFSIGHIAVILGLFPTVTIPYPFLSYNPSYQLVFIIAIAIILKIQHQQKEITSAHNQS